MSAPHITDEARAKSFLEGWQAEERFKAQRNARVRREARALQAGSRPLHKPACTPAGDSLPSGPAPDFRVTALAIAASVVVLPIALIGYIGIAVAVEALRRIRRA